MIRKPDVRLIAHRGNLRGRDPRRENQQQYIDDALELGYEAEVDLWALDGSLWLGHDTPQYETSLNWIEERHSRLWVHCKNVEAVDYLFGSSYNWFFHDQDDLTITSQGFVWCYPGVSLPSQEFVMLSFGQQEPTVPDNVIGICSDYLASWSD